MYLFDLLVGSRGDMDSARILLTVLLLCAGTQAEIFFDLLSVPQGPLSSTGGEFSSLVAGSDIMGGDRELAVTYSGSGSITSEVTGDEWVTTITGSGSHLATLRWDGTGNAANTRDLDLADRPRRWRRREFPGFLHHQHPPRL